MVKMKIAPSSGGANLENEIMGTKVTHESTYDVYCEDGTFYAVELTTGDKLTRLNRNVWKGRDGLIRGELVSLLETGVAEERKRRYNAARKYNTVQDTRRQTYRFIRDQRQRHKAAREPRGNGNGRVE